MLFYKLVWSSCYGLEDIIWTFIISQLPFQGHNLLDQWVLWFCLAFYHWPYVSISGNKWAQKRWLLLTVHHSFHYTSSPAHWNWTLVPPTCFRNTQSPSFCRRSWTRKSREKFHLRQRVYWPAVQSSFPLSYGRGIRWGWKWYQAPFQIQWRANLHCWTNDYRYLFDRHD